MATLEVYFRVALAVAAIFGIAGAWGYHLLSRSNDELSALQSSVAVLGETVKSYETTFQGMVGDAKRKIAEAADAEIDRVGNAINVENLVVLGQQYWLRSAIEAGGPMNLSVRNGVLAKEGAVEMHLPQPHQAWILERVGKGR